MVNTNSRIHGWIVTLAWALLFPVGAAATTNFDSGYQAYQQGNYKSALAMWRRLADQGDPRAQYNVGVMYADGRGVERNSVTAVRWWRQAAEQGHARAQHNLGLAFVGGEGVFRTMRRRQSGCAWPQSKDLRTPSILSVSSTILDSA